MVPKFSLDSLVAARLYGQPNMRYKAKTDVVKHAFGRGQLEVSQLNHN